MVLMPITRSHTSRGISVAGQTLGDARVVHENIDVAVTRGDVVDDTVHRRLVRDVEFVGFGAAARFFDFLGGRVGTLPVDVEDRDMRPLPCQDIGHRAA